MWILYLNSKLPLFKIVTSYTWILRFDMATSSVHKTHVTTDLVEVWTSDSKSHIPHVVQSSTNVMDFTEKFSVLSVRDEGREKFLLKTHYVYVTIFRPRNVEKSEFYCTCISGGLIMKRTELSILRQSHPILSASRVNNNSFLHYRHFVILSTDGSVFHKLAFYLHYSEFDFHKTI